MDGYTAEDRYELETSEAPDRFDFTLRRVHLPRSFRKRFHHDEKDARRYREVVRLGWSMGAYDGRGLVGLALAEPRAWNRSVWVWELAVARPLRRRGIATRLVHELSRRAAAEGYRVLVCETQSTNVPAIDFYLRTGFRIEGVDLSYYTNEDVRKGEVALFMKRRVPVRRPTTRRRSRAPRRTSK